MLQKEAFYYGHNIRVIIEMAIGVIIIATNIHTREKQTIANVPCKVLSEARVPFDGSSSLQNCRILAKIIKP